MKHILESTLQFLIALVAFLPVYIVLSSMKLESLGYETASYLVILVYGLGLLTPFLILAYRNRS